MSELYCIAMNEQILLMNRDVYRIAVKMYCYMPSSQYSSQNLLGEKHKTINKTIQFELQYFDHLW